MSDVCEVLAESDVDGRSNSEFSGIGELTTSPCRPPTAGAPCEGLRRRDRSVRADHITLQAADCRCPVRGPSTPGQLRPS